MDSILNVLYNPFREPTPTCSISIPFIPNRQYLFKEHSDLDAS